MNLNDTVPPQKWRTLLTQKSSNTRQTIFSLISLIFSDTHSFKVIWNSIAGLLSFSLIYVDISSKLSGSGCPERSLICFLFLRSRNRLCWTSGRNFWKLWRKSIRSFRLRRQKSLSGNDLETRLMSTTTSTPTTPVEEPCNDGIRFASSIPRLTI